MAPYSRHDPWSDAPNLLRRDPVGTLQWLGDRLGKRRQQLFACACCRLVLTLQTEAHRYAELEAVEQALQGVNLGPPVEPRRPNRRVAHSNVAGVWAVETLSSLSYWEREARFAVPRAENHFFEVIDHAALALREAAGEPNWHPARRTLDELLREVAVAVLLPARSPNPAWLTWHGGTVRHMAQAIYEDHRFEEVPILADALEDAGCEDTDILDHCRGLGVHARGCWVLDHLLGLT